MANPTTNYQAGIESNQTVLSYAPEAVWGQVPAVQFQAVRLTSETLAGTKTRARPGEILSTGEVASAITTQEMASGNVAFALSFGTFDDWIAAALNSAWSTPLAINGVAGDITLSAGAAGTPRTLTSATAGKFTGIAVGQWVRIGGFAQPGANGIYQVTANTGLVLTILMAPVTTAETPAGTAAQVRASTIVNGTQFNSLHIQQQLSPVLYLRYPGSYISGMTMSGGVGQFLNGSFTVMAQNESPFAVNASTGAVIPAPTGKVHDPVSGFGGAYLDGVPIGSVLDSFAITTSDTGAAQEYGMGQAAAQGQIMGLLEATGTIKCYARDFSLYQRFKSETAGAISFVTRDNLGNAYVFTLLSATIQQPKIDAGGPNTAVYFSANLEGNAVPVTGGTIRVDRLSAQ